ncbi:50S ribosomal protein L33 [Lysinibacillus sp. NPDC056232]|uniref:50S ribosomal protein L33 n=1 Tax=Lysinibacillus sp. NPDC056232 TaxID=3345756 RepID=UPI0035D963A7
MPLLTLTNIGVSLEKTKCRKGDYVAKKVVLNCEKCGSRNYTFPAKADSTVRLELKKFCSHCNEHTVHKQTL